MNRPSVQGQIAATPVSAETKIGRRHVVLVNSGAKTVYIRLNDRPASVSDFPIGAGKSATLDCDSGSVIYSVTTICAGADATTVDYLGWN